MSNYLSKLNTEQRLAVKTIDGPLLIVAGAGTGKTTVLVNRCAYMLDKDINPKSILLLTFTNKAAKEMQERIKKSIGFKAEDITATTFHSFCASLMRQYAKFFELKNDFLILDSTDANDAISICRQEFIENAKKENKLYNLKEFPSAKHIQNIYEMSINNSDTIKNTINNSFISLNNYFEEITFIIAKYKDYKKEHNLLDYNDLLYYSEKLLNLNEGLRKYLDEKYKYIMCDEYQDTNTIQNNILSLLAKDYNNLAVVGDDNQSIYAFRCANIQNILEFESKFNAKKIILKENYRSTQEILDFSNCVMKHAIEGITKELHGQFHGLRPKLVSLPDTYHQNAYIIKKINKKHLQGVPYKNMAVICRGAAQTYMLELELNKSNIPYEKFGGIKFFEKSAIKDIIAYVKVASNFKDELSWFRILQLYPGIGKGYANKISKSISQNGISILDSLYAKRKFAPYLHEIKTLIQKLSEAPLNQQIKYLVNNYYFKIRKRIIDNSETDDVTKSDNFRKMNIELQETKVLVELAKEYEDTIKFLNDIILDAASPKKDGDYLNITTIHSAKGLEYDIVFMPDIIEEITPKCPKGHPDDPEELRCFYVAITRAKKELYLFTPDFSTSTYKRICGVNSHFINYDDVLKTLSNERIG